MYCGECGYHFEEHDVFCPNCGTRREVVSSFQEKVPSPVTKSSFDESASRMIHLWMLVLISFLSVIFVVLCFIYFTTDSSLNTKTVFQLESYKFYKPQGYVSKKKEIEGETYFFFSKSKGLSVQMNVQTMLLQEVSLQSKEIVSSLEKEYVLLDQDESTHRLRFLVQSQKGVFLLGVYDLGNTGVLSTWTAVLNEQSIADSDEFYTAFLESYSLLDIEFKAQKKFVVPGLYLTSSKSSLGAGLKLN